MAVYKRGERWHYRFQVDGKKFAGTAGAAGGKADAVALESKIRADHLAGRLGKVASHTVDDALLRWLSGEASRLRSVKSLTSQIKAIMDHTAGRQLAQIVLVAEAVKQAGIDAGLAIATINRRLAALRRVAHLAHDQWGWLTEQLGPRIKLLRGETKRHVYLTPTQVEHLAECCEHPQVALAIRLSARTGLRQGELLQVDTIHDGHIVIGPEISKTGRPRLVPVPADMSDLVLPIGLTYNTLRTYFERARTKADMPALHWHDLRHTAASWWAQSGATLVLLRDLLGHTTTAETSRYSHLMRADLRAGADRMTERMADEIAAAQKSQKNTEPTVNPLTTD